MSQESILYIVSLVIISLAYNQFKLVKKLKEVSARLDSLEKKTKRLQ